MEWGLAKPMHSSPTLIRFLTLLDALCGPSQNWVVRTCAQSPHSPAEQVTKWNTFHVFRSVCFACNFADLQSQDCFTESQDHRITEW